MECQKNKHKLQISQLCLLLMTLLMIIPTMNAANFPSQLILAKDNISLVKGQLDAEISPIAIVCTDNPCQTDHKFIINNNLETQIDVALYFKNGENYTFLATIGFLAPGERAEFSAPLRFYYNGLTTYVGRYALVSNEYYIKEFTIVEDWEKYEKSSSELIRLGAYIVAPVIGFILIFLLALVVKDAESRKYGKKGAYTDKNLFEFPRGLTTGEQAANGMTNPIIWAVIIIFAIALGCLIAFSTYSEYDSVTKFQIIFISFIASLIVPLILMLLTWYADIYEREPFRFVVGMFVYGIFAAFIAFFLNSLFLYFVGKTPDLIPIALSTAIIALIASPIIEEMLKAFGLAIFANHPEFDDALDGLLYGFAIGLGFAMYENWFYFLGSVDPIKTGIDSWLSIILYRSFFNTVAHASFTGFVGLLLGMMKSRPQYRNFFQIALIPGVFIAILLHVLFNITAYLDVTSLGEYRTILVSFNPSLVIGIAVAILIIYVFATIDTKRQRNLP